MHVSSRQGASRIGRTIAALHLVVGVIVGVVVWAGLFYLPVAAAMAIVLLAWPRNAAALLASLVLAAVLTLYGGVAAGSAFVNEDSSPIVLPTFAWALAASAALALSVVALRLRARP